jgi:hypothetical protein
MKTLCLLDNQFITFNDISELRTLVCYWNLSVNILKKKKKCCCSMVLEENISFSTSVLGIKTISCAFAFAESSENSE